MRHSPSRSQAAPAAVLFALLCATLTAANADAKAGGRLAGADDDVVSPPAQVLVEGAVDNWGGTITIPGGMHSASANAWHRFICASFGAEDITDVGPITFSADSADAVVCGGSSGRPRSAGVVPLIKDAQGRFHMPTAALREPAIDDEARRQCPPPR